MELRIYSQLYEVNRGFAQALQPLEELAKDDAFRQVAVRGLVAMVEEVHALINSSLTEVITQEETEQAGRLFADRLRREKSESGPD